MLAELVMAYSLRTHPEAPCACPCPANACRVAVLQHHKPAYASSAYGAGSYAAPAGGRSSSGSMAAPAALSRHRGILGGMQYGSTAEAGAAAQGLAQGGHRCGQWDYAPCYSCQSGRARVCAHAYVHTSQGVFELW